MANVLVDDTSLTAIANAIREKNGKLIKYKPSEMANAISNISGGGDLPAEALTISGNCSYRFSYDGWNWFIEKYGNQITTNNINDATHMFFRCTLTEIPFDLNFDLNSSYHDLNYIFFNCNNITKIHKLNNVIVYDTSYMFCGCDNLRTIPDDIADTWDWSYLESKTSNSTGNQSYMFQGCYSLRSFPMTLIKSGNPYLRYNNSYYYNGFYNCYSLDELINLPIPYTKAKWTSNAFYDIFRNCHRLKNITFKTNNDGTAIAVNWKSQFIDLTNNVGYASVGDEVTNYNSGITADKRVTDATSYEVLKNDPDWFTADVNYSRYNHDSAVNTINSLPDASAYLASYSGTNTIKFKGQAGASTDGGAINTLTETEIAVATAKGWTCSFA